MRTVSSYAAACVTVLALSVAMGPQGAAAQTQPHRTVPAMADGAARARTMSMPDMMARLHELQGTMSSLVGQSEGTMPGGSMKPGRGRATPQGQGGEEMGQSMMGPTGTDMMGPSGEGGLQGDGSVTGLSQSVSDLTGSMDQVMRELQAMLSSRRTMDNPKLERRAKNMQQNLSTMMHGLEGMVHNLREMQGRPEPQK